MIAPDGETSRVLAVQLGIMEVDTLAFLAENRSRIYLHSWVQLTHLSNSTRYNRAAKSGVYVALSTRYAFVFTSTTRNTINAPLELRSYFLVLNACDPQSMPPWSIEVTFWYSMHAIRVRAAVPNYRSAI